MKKYLINSVLLSLLFLGLFLVTSCQVEGRYTQDINVGSVKTLESGLVIHETGMNRLIYLEPTQDSVTLTEFFRANEEETLLWSMTGPDTENPAELFQMMVPTDDRNAEITETLIRFSFDGSAPEETRYEVQSPFSAMVFGPSQEYAILYHSEDQGGDFDLFNPNEVAILDLGQAPSETNPSIMSVDLNGHTITGISFLQPLSVGGVQRQFAVFMAEGVVRLVDLLDTSAAARIRLTTDDDPRHVIPKQVIARDADEIRNPMIFIRASDSQDIYAISVGPDPDGGAGFMATMNQFEAYGDPLDMVAVQDGEDPLLVVLSKGTAAQSNHSIFNVVDIDTSSPFTIFTDDISKKLLKRQTDTGEQIVAYGNNMDRISFLEVSGLVEERDHNLEDVEIPDGIDHSLLLDSNRLLILSDSNQDIILLDLDTQKSTRFSAPSLSYDDWATAQIHDDWFFFVPSNNYGINMVDLTTDHPDALLLDDFVSSLHLINESNMGVCMHQTQTGRVTVFPLDDPTRGNSFVVDGLWISNFLNQTEVTQ